MNKHILLFLIVGVWLVSCKKDKETVASSVDGTIQAWLDTMNITATKDANTGIYTYPEISNSSGTGVSSGNIVAIFYTLKDLNGNVISSYTRSNGDSLLFKVGASAVFPVGVDYAVAQMKSGETYNFILPPNQAYASVTSGVISSNLIALLQIELVAVHTESDISASELTQIDQYITSKNLNDSTMKKFPASGIAYKRLRTGLGDRPLNGDSVQVSYSGKLINGNTFGGDTNFQWIYGSGQPKALLSGFEFGVSLMQVGEQALVIIPSSQAYRESALVIPENITGDLIENNIVPDYVASVPPYQTLIFTINRVN